MKPYDKGYAAFWKGDVGNPHPTNTNKNREWERGWNAAYFENLKAVEDEEQTRTGS